MKHKSQTFSSSLKYTHSHFHLFDYIIAACMVYTTKLQLNTGLMQASKGITNLPQLLYRAIDNTIIPAKITIPEPQYANTAFPIISLNNSIPHIPAIKIPHWNLKHKNKHIRWLLTLVV